MLVWFGSRLQRIAVIWRQIRTYPCLEYFRTGCAFFHLLVVQGELERINVE